MKNICVECNSTLNIVQHHIIPQSKGGKFTVPLCQICHDIVHDCRQRKISISELTKLGLERARKKGKKLGSPNPSASLKHMQAGIQTKKYNFIQYIKPIVEDIKKEIQDKNQKITLQKIVFELNQKEIKTSNGKKWYATSLKRYNLI